MIRLRSQLGLFLLALWLGVGCRKPLTPSVDRDLPPETWITAAPQDTLTTRDENGSIVPGQPGTIPFRFHAYWSGSDPDGRVVGFYWAVVETAGSVAGLPIPPLPGPRAHDYHYTTVRDSVFIFNVFEETNNRQHAFYIYAVDDKGKADATPARVIFNSLDLYPPIPVIEQDSTRATGYVFHPSDAWDGVSTTLPAPRETTVALRDTFNRATAVSDIVPIGSIVRVRWHSEIRIANNPAVAYKYKIGEGAEVEFVEVPASVTGTQYNTNDANRLGPGLKVFTLRAIDQAGGARTSPETTRRFSMNMIPDTWLAGPDTVPEANPNFYHVERYANGQLKERYRQVGIGDAENWATPFPGSLMSPDSLLTMPARRTACRTFFEIYHEYNFANPGLTPARVYVRGEGDTVHMNSYVLFHGGGFDPDSPYSPRIVIDYPPLLVRGRHPVERPGPANGSPSGLRLYIPVRLDSVGPVSGYPLSQVYPLSDPAFVGEYHIGGYLGMQQSGRAYAILRAVDGNGGLDERIPNPVTFVDSIERGLIRPGSPRYALRDRVLTFYVNRAPYLLLDDPGFRPYPGEEIHGRSIPLTLDLAADDDPYQSIQRKVGGVEPASLPRVLRFSVFLRGRSAAPGPPRDTVYAPDNLSRKTGVESIQSIEVPSYIQGPQVAVEIEVCDCKECEASPGQGRCRRYPPIVVTLVDGPAAAGARRAR